MSTRRFGITINKLSGVGGMIVNSITVNHNTETAEARDQAGRLIDLVAYSLEDQITIDGLYTGDDVSPGTVLVVNDDEYLITSTGRQESNTAFQTTSLRAINYPQYVPPTPPTPPPTPTATISLATIPSLNWDFENASTSSINFSYYVAYDGSSTLNYSITETLPVGVTFNGSILSADKELMEDDINTTLTLNVSASDVSSTATEQFNIQIVNVVEPVPPQPIDPSEPLTFKGVDAVNTIQLSAVGNPDPIVLKAKINNGEWTSIQVDQYSYYTAILHQGDTIAFSGANYTFSKDPNNYYQFAMTGAIEASGNIQSLNNYSTAVPAYGYYNLFAGCTGLLNLPELSATTLANNCYDNMFAGCTGVSSIPNVDPPYLPAETLATYCYNGMFKNCTSITEAPQNLLVASSLVSGCYQNMFEGCTSLSDVPVLNASVLAKDCYASMFKDCSSLLEAPELNATNLVDGCYQQMFYGCTNLGKIIVGFTDWGTNNDQYTLNWVNGVAEEGVFAKPSSLASLSGVSNIPYNWTVISEQVDPPDPPIPPTSVPVGSATIVIANIPNISWDFENASTSSVNLAQYVTYEDGSSVVNYSITETLPVGVSFNNGILSADKNLMTGDVDTTLTLSAYASDAEGVTDQFGFEVTNVIEPVPPQPSETPLTFKGLSSTNAVQLNQYNSPSAIVLDYSKNGGAWTTYNIGDIIELDQNETVTFSGANDHFSTDEGNRYQFAMTGTIEASGNIQSLMNYSTSATDWCYYMLFGKCSSLVQAPKLPATTLASGCYGMMFFNCKALTSILYPVLPATTLAPHCYNSMFYGCTSLTNGTVLNATTLAPYCCNDMFANCTSITYAQLPATILADYCYSGMFYHCSNLSLIIVNFTDWNGFTNSTSNWVNGVAGGGTFYKPSNLSTNFDYDRIPLGWTVNNGSPW